MKKFINLTPHAINLNNGTVYPPSGQIARIDVSFSRPNEDGICYQEFGDFVGFPKTWQEDTIFIVSGMVLAALKESDAGFKDRCVAPATGHPDCKRNEKGQIISVPGFVY